MVILRKMPFRLIVICLLMAAALLVIAACTSEGSNSGTNRDATGNNAEHEDEAEHEEGAVTVPNNGAIIRIVSPADGATFAEGDEVTIEVEVENFELVDGAHWHILVDGGSWGMVMDGHLDQTLRGLEVGEHEIAVFLAGADHIDLEEGDSIHITVTE
jgi:hypothetical protein